VIARLFSGRLALTPAALGFATLLLVGWVVTSL
jgi:hypothetical protein